LGSLIERNGTNYWFSQEAAALFNQQQPGPGELGNTGRNYFIGPQQFQTDISLSKKFRFTERLNFDLRVDVRNLTNSPSFGFGGSSATFAPQAVVNADAFGQVKDNVLSFARRVQFSGKINF
jgi:hypothetical protein